MTDPSARITRIAAPISSPGVCVICGKSSHPLGFADANLHFEFHGTFYLCADCAGEYARVFGYISPDEYSTMRDSVAAQNDELNTLRQAVLGLESTVDNLIGDAHRRSSQRADAIQRDRDERSSEPVDEPDAGPPGGDTTGADTIMPATESRPAESTDERRRDNLLDTSTADELLGLS